MKYVCPEVSMICPSPTEGSAAMKGRNAERRFYCIERTASAILEPLELYTIDDVRDVAEESQKLNPEQELTIREFEII
jgi:hypothetical protein